VKAGQFWLGVASVCDVLKCFLASGLEEEREDGRLRGTCRSRR
jgi:hypothetical protein